MRGAGAPWSCEWVLGSGANEARQSLACRCSLREPQAPERWRASSAPVTWRCADRGGRAGGDGSVGQAHLGARREIEASLDDAVIAQGDAQARLGAEQAALADPHPFGATPGERPHGRCATADVGPVVNDDPLTDPTLDHRGPQGSCVEVDEALMHDRCPAGQVGAQAHPVSVGDPHAGRHDVVDHAGELVDAEDDDRTPSPQPGPGVLEGIHRARAVVGPHDIGQLGENALEVERVGLRQAVREQVQPQVGVGGVRGGRIEIHCHQTDLAPHPPARVGGDQSAQSLRWCTPSGYRPEGWLGKPGVQGGAGVGHGGQPVSPGRAWTAHGPSS